MPPPGSHHGAHAEGGLRSRAGTFDREPASQPLLVVVGPASMRGQAFALSEGELAIGRGPDNDVRLDDPFVSRQHARIRNASGHLTLADAHSTTGLFVNGVRVLEPSTLGTGDLIRLGAVELEVMGAAHDTPLDQRTEVFPTIQAPLRRFDVQSQYGGVISNVAGNQYNTALKLEPMRRRARVVMRLGFLLFLAGLTIAIVAWVNWATPILNCISNSGSNPDPSPTSCVNASAFLTFAAGGFVSTIGLITMITSLFMKRHVRRQEAQL